MNPSKASDFTLVFAIITIPLGLVIGPALINSMPMEKSILFVFPVPIIGFLCALFKKNKFSMVANAIALLALSALAFWFYLWKDY